MTYVRGLKRTEHQPSVSRRVARLRRGGALVLSFVAHLVIFGLAFSAASGSPVSAAGASGGPTGPVFTVTVVRLASTSAAAHEHTADLQPLFAKLRPGATGQPLPFRPSEHPSDVAALVDRIRSQQPSPIDAKPTRRERVADVQGSRSPSPELTSKSQRPTDAQQADTDGDAAGSVSTGKLWGAIEPCWRNLGARGRVPVVLEVALDGTGDLRVPPKVIRSTTALLNEPRLQAEASALAAVAACVPRGDLKLGGKTYRLEFPAAP